MRKSQAEINEWIRQQQDRLGIVPPRIYPNMSAARRFQEACTVPMVTVYPSPYVIERLAHAAADAKIASDPRYAAMCERLDAELAEILEGVRKKLTPLHRRKSALAQIEQVRPRMLTND